MPFDIKNLKSPADLKILGTDELKSVAADLRAALISKLAARGGHVGPNLGVVEATVALHYVFDAPKDRMVFDVSHQTYVHKMITGRIYAFLDPAHYDDVTGYTCPAESSYDLFEMGHTSSSIALATGLAKARDLSAGNENVIAFIGDASLGGGEALEALNFAPTLNSNFILIVNDNQMSIAENHGALFPHLENLRNTRGKAGNNIFKALGYEYVYVDNGNDIEALVKVFREVRNCNHAVVVHLNTLKGKGLPVAEEHKEAFHYSMPFDTKTGQPLHNYAGENYCDLFAQGMLKRMESDGRIVVLTAGTPGAIGFTPDRRNAAGNRFVDVGIAEQHAVAMAAGLAKDGYRPVMGVVTPFLQRAYDQLSQEVGVNSMPIVIVEFYTGILAMNDVTHLGLFDVAMVSNIPGVLMLSPATAEEYEAMLSWAINQTETAVVIRTPGGAVKHSAHNINTDFRSYEILEQGKDIALISAGTFVPTALEAAEILKKQGINPTVINARVLSNVDKNCLDALAGYRHVVTIEDGILDGGFGQKIAAFLSAKNVKVTCLGLKKQLIDRFNAAELLKDNSLTAEQIASLAK